MLEWNQRTGNYEGEWNGQRVVVSGDAVAEAQQADALNRFGIEYADLDNEQTDAVDRENLSAFAWADADDNQAR